MPTIPTRLSEISPLARRSAVLIAVALALSGMTACGGSDEDEGSSSATASIPNGESALTAAKLTPSFAGSALTFANRGDSILRASLDRSLGKGAALALKPGSADCRPAAETPSDTDPGRFPFACIIGGTAASGGVSTTFLLGFVVFDVKGGCWHAANERISAAAAGPVLIPQDRALQPENVIAGCAAL